MSEVNHILVPGQVYKAEQGVAAYRAAVAQEVFDAETKSWWLWYTMGADLAPKIDDLNSRNLTLSDPVVTGLYAIGVPIHRREIVSRDKGPDQAQALADADGENDYPRFMANQPVCYTRQADGQEWLVYARGPHMRDALAALWKANKAIIKVEVPCTDEDGAPLLFKGKKVYRRLIVAKDHPAAVNPAEVK